MASPAWLTATPADVQNDGRLSAAMLKATYSDNDAATEISRQIIDWSSVVISRLRRAAVNAGLTATFDDDLSTVLNTEQQKTACQALKLLVISALWKNLPGADSQYNTESNDTGGSSLAPDLRLISGEGLLKELEADIKTQGDLTDASNLSGYGSSIQMTRTDGYSQHPLNAHCGRRR